MKDKILFLTLPIIFVVPLIYYLVVTSDQTEIKTIVQPILVKPQIDKAPLSDTPLNSESGLNISRELLTVSINLCSN